MINANARDIDTAGKTVLHHLLTKEKLFSDFLNLSYEYPEYLPTHQDFLGCRDLDVLKDIQKLHSSYKFIEATGGRPANDDLFYRGTIAKGLPIPEHPNEVAFNAEVQLRKLAAETAKTEARAKFLAEHAHLLDLPKRFMTMLENLDEKELMITMLHRLV